MATSVLMASDLDHENPRREVVEMNLAGPEVATRPESHGKRCGRRKSKSNEGGQKKQTQRGMGVAKLERLRMQGLKNITGINPNPNPNSNTNTSPIYSVSHQSYQLLSSEFVDPAANKFGNFGAMNGPGLNQALLVQRLGSGAAFVGPVPTSGFGMVFPEQFVVDHPYGNGAPNVGFRAGNVNMVAETSKELSSIPDMRCYSEHCGVCHKKKRINGDISGCNGAGCNGVLREVFPDISLTNSSVTFMGMSNAGNKLHINGQSQEYGTKQNTHQYPWAGRKINLQEAEVRAVHRNGNYSGGAGNSDVLMEYEFFPPGKSGGKSSSFEEWIKLGSSESSSSFAAGAAIGGGESSCLTTTNKNTTTSSAGFGAASSSNSIDLSLKLSSY